MGRGGGWTAEPGVSGRTRVASWAARVGGPNAVNRKTSIANCCCCRERAGRHCVRTMQRLFSV